MGAMTTAALTMQDFRILTGAEMAGSQDPALGSLKHLQLAGAQADAEPSLAVKPGVCCRKRLACRQAQKKTLHLSLYSKCRLLVLEFWVAIIGSS